MITLWTTRWWWLANKTTQIESSCHVPIDCIMCKCSCNKNERNKIIIVYFAYFDRQRSASSFLGQENSQIYNWKSPNHAAQQHICWAIQPLKTTHPYSSSRLTGPFTSMVLLLFLLPIYSLEREYIMYMQGGYLTIWSEVVAAAACTV